MILSLVMQSYLGDYSGAASNREDKFLRALAGFHGQSRPSDEIELIIVSHGCDKTIEIASDFIKKWSITNIHLHKAERGTLFEGKPRDIGIENANGAYISYLDTDDMILSNHCDKIIKNIAYWKCDWMYYNDYIKVHALYLLSGNDLQQIFHCCGVDQLIRKLNRSDFVWLASFHNHRMIVHKPVEAF